MKAEQDPAAAIAAVGVAQAMRFPQLALTRQDEGALLSLSAAGSFCNRLTLRRCPLARPAGQNVLAGLSILRILHYQRLSKISIAVAKRVLEVMQLLGIFTKPDTM